LNRGRVAGGRGRPQPDGEPRDGHGRHGRRPYRGRGGTARPGPAARVGPAGGRLPPRPGRRPCGLGTGRWPGGVGPLGVSARGDRAGPRGRGSRRVTASPAVPGPGPGTIRGTSASPRETGTLCARLGRAAPPGVVSALWG